MLPQAPIASVSPFFRNPNVQFCAGMSSGEKSQQCCFPIINHYFSLSFQILIEQTRVVPSCTTLKKNNGECLLVLLQMGVVLICQTMLVFMRDSVDMPNGSDQLLERKVC